MELILHANPRTCDEPGGLLPGGFEVSALGCESSPVPVAPIGGIDSSTQSHCADGVDGWSTP
jgi:hypothetical protein